MPELTKCEKVESDPKCLVIARKVAEIIEKSPELKPGQKPKITIK
jgi:hypothetical protein